MSRVIEGAFPPPRFIHLHRDSQHDLSSVLSEPPALIWENERHRYMSEPLAGHTSATILEQNCRYWRRCHRRIRDDLQGRHCLLSKSIALFAGHLDELVGYVGPAFKTRNLPPGNADKPAIREERRHSSFEWSEEDKATLYRSCGDLMAAFGYGAEVQAGLSKRHMPPAAEAP